VQVEVAITDGVTYLVRRIEAPAGITAADALRLTGATDPVGRDDVTFGIFSRPTQPDTVLANGDRLEVYLPLRVDPKLARQRRAQTANKKTSVR